MIDDDPNLLATTGLILESHGFRVRLASCGADAIAMVARVGPPDLVLTDLTMPDMDGAEVARRLKAGWPELPIIIVSGHSVEHVREGWAIDPMIHLLQKPLASEQLVEALVAALSEATVRFP